MSGLTGRFLGRDPIGYFDQLNLFASLLDFRLLDPSGFRKIVGHQNGYPLYQWEPGDSGPVPPVPGNNCYSNSIYGPLWQICLAIPPDDQVGVSFSDGLQGLYDLLPMLDAACARCCKDCDCSKTSRGFVSALMQAWIDFYGTGPETQNTHRCGGYMCYDWAGIFDHDVKTRANLGGCFTPQIQAAFAINPEPGGELVTHFWVKISAGNGGAGCEVFVDDGWGNGSTSNSTFPLRNPPDYHHPLWPEQITLPRCPIDPTREPWKKRW